MKRLLALAALALVVPALTADAASFRLNPGLFQSAAVTTSSQVLVGPGSILPAPKTSPVSAFLYLENPKGATATICISFGSTATISGTTCAGGEITLSPGDWRFFDTSLPTDVVYAIGSGSQALTVGAQ